jgi:hypothetical protein
VSAARHVIHFHRMKGMLLLTLPIQAVFALGRRPRFTVGDSIEWNPECKKVSGTSVINAEFVKFQLRRLKTMYTAGSHPLTSPVAVFPGEVDVRGKRRTALCGMNRNALPKNRNWSTRSLGFRNLVPGAGF